MEGELDADLALLPFKPLAMKVLQCSFLSGMRSSKVAPLMEKLRPKCVLLPDYMKTLVHNPKANSMSIVYYSENIMLRVPSLKESADLDMLTELHTQCQETSLKEENSEIARLMGELTVDKANYLITED